MNKVWLFLLISALVALTIFNPQSVLVGLSTAGNKAVKLCLELCAIYAVWTGIFNILSQTKISKWLNKLLSPIVNLIFGKNNLDEQSKNLVCMNMSANILGMNGAATPLGIKAIESMNKNNTRNVATYPMIMLVVISCTSIQLLPTSIIGMLTSANATNPSSIIIPSLIAGFFSTLIGILLVKLCHFIELKIEKRKSTNG